MNANEDDESLRKGRAKIAAELLDSQNIDAAELLDSQNKTL